MIWVLVGMMGTGKSTVAAALAGELGCTAVDIDDLVEERESRPVRTIFESDGEAYFRRLESETLAEVIDAAPPAGDLVVATGGGVVTTAESRALLRSLRNDDRHVVVWLDARPETIVGRLDTTDRPLLAGMDEAEVHRRVVSLSEERRAWYADCATFRVECDDLTPSAVAAAILAGTPASRQVGR